MREFGMGYVETLQLPLRTFWMLNRQINRLRAENELRILKLNVCVNDEKAFKATYAELQAEIESPVRLAKTLDEGKFLELQKRFQGAS